MADVLSVVCTFDLNMSEYVLLGSNVQLTGRQVPCRCRVVKINYFHFQCPNLDLFFVYVLYYCIFVMKCTSSGDHSAQTIHPVSYTHLTLPTTPYV